MKSCSRVRVVRAGEPRSSAIIGSSLAVLGNALYVCDFKNHQILVFDRRSLKHFGLDAPSDPFTVRAGQTAVVRATLSIPAAEPVHEVGEPSDQEAFVDMVMPRDHRRCVAAHADRNRDLARIRPGAAVVDDVELVRDGERPGDSGTADEPGVEFLAIARPVDVLVVEPEIVAVSRRFHEPLQAGFVGALEPRGFDGERRKQTVRRRSSGTDPAALRRSERAHDEPLAIATDLQGDDRQRKHQPGHRDHRGRHDDQHLPSVFGRTLEDQQS